MNTNPLQQLAALGQSIWLDYIRRDLITSGKLKQMIDEDGLRGMTSNPAIFEAAIVGSHGYDDDIQSMARAGKDVKAIYEALSQQDVQSAADVFRPLYDETEGRDGYVSLEVNPHLAYNTGGSVDEAHDLWKALARPNVFIKVPGTSQGLPVIQELISEGVNVNVTLLFSLPRYRQVAEAYIAGIETRITLGQQVDRVASVASFFVSRIDALIDPMLEKLTAEGGENGALAQKLHGQVAISSAKMAYQIYKELFEGDRFKKLAAHGARPQRLLWASTSTKNPTYPDVMYVEALIGPNTVDTAPMETIDAFRDHGKPASRLEDNVDQARWVLDQLPAVGIDLVKLTQQLEDEAAQKFDKPFDKLMASLTDAAGRATGNAS